MSEQETTGDQTHFGHEHGSHTINHEGSDTPHVHCWIHDDRPCLSDIRPGDRHSPPGDYLFWDPMVHVHLLLDKIKKKVKRGKK